MKKTTLLTVLCLLSVQATAGLIAEVYNDGGGGSDISNAEAVIFQLWYSESYWIPDPIQSTIIDWPMINVGDSIGETFYLESGADPEFGNFVSFLTNGVDDHFRSNVNVDGNDNPGGEYESNFFGNTNPIYRHWSLSINGIDLQGFTIERIGLTVNSGNDFVFRFYGTPEPCTLALLGLGGLLIRKR
jgi:hypothetical protein